MLRISGREYLAWGHPGLSGRPVSRSNWAWPSDGVVTPGAVVGAARPGVTFSANEAAASNAPPKALPTSDCIDPSNRIERSPSKLDRGRPGRVLTLRRLVGDQRRCGST